MFLFLVVQFRRYFFSVLTTPCQIGAFVVGAALYALGDVGATMAGLSSGLTARYAAIDVG